MKNNWNYVSLESICKIIGGGTPTKANESYYNGNIPWATVRDMKNELIINTQLNITILGLTNSSSNVIPKNNIIIATRVGLGKVCLLKNDTAINQDLKGIIPKGNGVIPKFLYWYFLSISEKIIKKGTGATVQGVKLTFIKSLEIPNISIEEQKRIVSILDRAFTTIDQAKANIEKNIVNAKELFQSKLDYIFSQKGDGWEEKPLGAVCEIKPPKKISKEKLSDDDLVSFVPMKYLKVNQMYFNSEETKTLKQAYSGYVYFEEGDVILAKITPCFENGKLGIAKGLQNGMGFGSSEYVVYRADKTKISSEYLYFFLNRESFRIKGKSLMSGAVGHKRIQPTFYENEVIFLPSIDIQNVILENITTLQISLSQIETNYKQKLLDLEELKKSILQKAFSGELTQKEVEV
jgi:type I restriction enzyme S subunit